MRTNRKIGITATIVFQSLSILLISFAMSLHALATNAADNNHAAKRFAEIYDRIQKDGDTATML
jgi:hypothetical protein